MIAQELRIGNYVYYQKDKHFYDIRSVCRDRVNPINIVEHDGNVRYAVDCLLEDLLPIPLTSDILKKVFTADNYGVFYKTLNKDNYIWTKKFMGTWQICVGQELDNLRQIASIKYLHSLQNIIHALTNKELKINL